MSPTDKHPTGEGGELYDPGLGETLPERAADVAFDIARGVVDVVQAVRSTLAGAVEAAKTPVHTARTGWDSLQEMTEYLASNGSGA